MEMAMPPLQNAIRLATQGGTEMDSTGEKKPRQPKKTWRRTVEQELKNRASLCRQHL
ncbi:hypothetical protein DPMN_024075 [Dreissena polymorpha]|uniref:Uncharacterized protein n=1 Tax=Dreissena polymorpha TaxID=45954 RepID=A0A9D4LP37_DREPO|nr:hypothetical protein DPMN_024075 [Dreissena polymorpha]